ncbi:response regulator transcription factor [Limnobacter humi]|uniref:Response regulator transcription factor n=1 Tax=Limnobacter humi TaxID=1778671 RepID=A0ABT1WEA5_9BURK|nr:response regulator transcription factor [Limnobacter humi]MCQ8895072.1 response regulator transcription factor [Limnobacter humi]
MSCILIVDDHTIIRKGLIQILHELDTRHVCLEASDGVQAIRILREQRTDVVLLDVALGERDGFDVLRSIRSEFPKLGVIVLSVYPESQFATRAIRSGANAYLNKGCSPQELGQAVSLAAQGQVYLTPLAAGLLAQTLRQPADQPRHAVLSNREMQVLRMLSKGESVQHIAQSLCLSSNTVSTYRARVFDKLQLKNLVELVNYTKEHGLE